MDQLLLFDDNVSTIKQKLEQPKGVIRIVTYWEIEKEFQRVALVYAHMLRDEANEDLEEARRLRREIISYGGISADYYERWNGKKWVRKYSQEYKDIPVKYHRRDGFSLDCIAQEMGYEDDEALRREIESAEEVMRSLPKIGHRPVRRFRIKDFMFQAYQLTRRMEERNDTVLGKYDVQN